MSKEMRVDPLFNAGFDGILMDDLADTPVEMLCPAQGAARDPPCVGTALYRGLQWVPVIVEVDKSQVMCLLGIAAWWASQQRSKHRNSQKKDSPTFNPCASEARFCAAIFRGLSLIVSSLRSYRLRMRGNRQSSNQLALKNQIQ